MSEKSPKKFELLLKDENDGHESGRLQLIKSYDSFEKAHTAGVDVIRDHPEYALRLFMSTPTGHVVEVISL